MGSVDDNPQRRFPQANQSVREQMRKFFLFFIILLILSSFASASELTETETIPGAPHYNQVYSQLSFTDKIRLFFASLTPQTVVGGFICAESATSERILDKGITSESAFSFFSKSVLFLGSIKSESSNNFEIFLTFKLLSYLSIR